MALNGYDLQRKFQELGVECKLDVRLLHSWFDTEDEDMKEFLSWICLDLGEENTLTPFENKEYQEQERSNKNMCGDVSDEELLFIEEKCPGIFDIDEFDVDCLKEECEILQEEKKEDLHLIDMHVKLGLSLINQLAKEDDSELKLSIKEKKLKSECLKMCQLLDDRNSQLHTQLKKYGDRLNNIEDSYFHNFICNSPIEAFYNYYEAVMVCTSRLINEDKNIAPPHLTPFYGNQENFGKELDKMELAILEYLSKNASKQFKLDELEGQINFLKDLEPRDMYHHNINSSIYHTESKISTKKEDIEIVVKKLLYILKDAAKNYIDAVKLKENKEIIVSKKNKSIKLKNIASLMEILISYHILSVSLFTKENFNMELSAKLFKHMYTYLNQLNSCVSRVELMENCIEHYWNYENIPLEHRCKLLDYFRKMLVNQENEHLDLLSIVHRTQSLGNDYNLLANKIIFENCDNLNLNTKVISRFIKDCKTYLSSKTTNGSIIIQGELLHVAEEVENEIEIYKTAIGAAVENYNTAKASSTTNKNQQIYRQLWMLFLADPKKMLNLIQESQQKIKNKWAEKYTATNTHLE